MTEELQLKIKEHFLQMAILRNQVSASSLFAGRNLPSFVMDFVTKRYLNSMGEINGLALSQFLDTVIPKKATSVKDRLGSGQEVMLMTRFNVYIDLIKNVRRFGIPDLGIKLKEGIIPPYIFEKHRGELVDGEIWG